MPRPPRALPPGDARGSTLVELAIALVVLALGLLAVGQLFPAGSRHQLQSRMRSSASLNVCPHTRIVKRFW